MSGDSPLSDVEKDLIQSPQLGGVRVCTFISTVVQKQTAGGTVLWLSANTLTVITAMYGKHKPQTLTHTLLVGRMSGSQKMSSSLSSISSTPSSDNLGSSSLVSMLSVSWSNLLVVL